MISPLQSKFPKMGDTIFSHMSRLANKYKALNLSQGFPEFDCSPVLKERVCHHIKAGNNQYAPMPGHLPLREILAERCMEEHGHAYHPETEVTITAGATQAIMTAILALVHPQEEVIIIEPAYDCYQPAIELAGAQAVPIQLNLEDGTLSVEHLKDAISDKTRMLIVNSPHNPSGNCMDNSTWLDIQDALKDTNILVLSDEVYEYISFDQHAHISPCRYPDLAHRSIRISSMGKTYHNTGWKLGYCMAPAPLMKEFRKIHQFNVFSVNTPVQMAFSDFLKRDQSHLELANFYQAKRNLFVENIDPSKFNFSPSKGTYFQLLDYSMLNLEGDLSIAERWTKEHGLATIPISAFYDGKFEGHFLRFCFAKNDKSILRATEILNAIPT